MKIAVLGGGAAGIFAAIHASGNGNKVTVYEKGTRFLAKVRVSGGGRCNVTNSCDHPRELATYYPRGHRELPGPFTRFNTTHTQNWFESRGVRLKTESDGRVFPVTDSSQTIIDCLLHEAEILGVALKLNESVTTLNRTADSWELHMGGGGIVAADKVIVATGGHPLAKSYDWLGSLGHTIVPPVPSLFTFNIPENPFDGLQGIAVPSATLRILDRQWEQSGPLLFTHWGLSGPVVLRLSAWAARDLAKCGYRTLVQVNFFPDLNTETCRIELNSFARSHTSHQPSGSPFRSLPARLWERLCLRSGIDAEVRWGSVGKKTIARLAEQCCATTLEVNGKTTFREEFVTCGGVSLREVNFKTMESRILPGLYFAGEILDIDALTGGFNFQAAWTTGYLAGISASGILVP